MLQKNLSIAIVNFSSIDLEQAILNASTRLNIDQRAKLGKASDVLPGYTYLPDPVYMRMYIYVYALYVCVHVPGSI